MPNYMGRRPNELEAMRAADKQAKHERLIETFKFVGKVAVVMTVVFAVAFAAGYLDLPGIGPENTPSFDPSTPSPSPSAVEVTPSSLGTDALTLVQPD